MAIWSSLKKRIVLFLDSDIAGKSATVNIILQLLKQEIDCEVVKPDYQGDPDEVCRQFSQQREGIIDSSSESTKKSIQEVLHQREKPYLFILHYYFDKWEIGENPQRIRRFISEMSLLFQEFKINIRNFLVEKISQLVDWKREQVEVFFTPRYSPILHFSQVKYYGQSVIQSLEKKVIFLCGQEKFFWLSVIVRKYFFNHPANRKSWQTLCHYYLGGKKELEKPLREGGDYQMGKENLKKSSTLDQLFQKIAEVKLFIEPFTKP